MYPELERHIAHIEQLDELHLELLKEMLLSDQGKMFGLDILASAVIKRSMSLCSGFSSLVRESNYTSAAALVRLQLDSCLRFYAAFIVENPHELATKILRGTPVRKMKDRNGVFMTDKYLVNKLAEEYEWMPRVYDATSGFLHLSERHIFIVFQSKNNHKVSLEIGSDDKKIPAELWIEMAMTFLACTDVLFEYLKGWVFTKQKPRSCRALCKRIEPMKF